MVPFLRKWRKARRQRRKYFKRLTRITQFALEDIFIVGYPKSGNTWFQDLITAVVYGVHPAFAPPTLAQMLVPDVHKQPYYRRFSTPMFFKSHSRPRPKYRRVVYLMRDGRDVLVSLYHYEKAMNRPIDLEELVRKGHPSHGKWHTHVTDWLANPHGAEMLMVRYEDLKQNATREMERFCAFAGIKRDSSFLETMVRETAFEKMQQREIRSGSGMRAFPTDKLFRRRGIAGSHKDEMPPALAGEFLALAGETFQRCGYA